MNAKKMNEQSFSDSKRKLEHLNGENPRMLHRQNNEIVRSKCLSRKKVESQLNRKSRIVHFYEQLTVSLMPR